MLKSIRTLFASEVPQLRSPAVTELLRRQVQLVMKGLQRAAVRELIEEEARKAAAQGPVNEQVALEIAKSVITGSASLALPVTTMRLCLLLAEFVLAAADTIDEQDPPAVVDTVAALLPELLSGKGDRKLAATMLAVHCETVAALLPDGWSGKFIDVPQYRDEGWGLLIGNAMAGVVFGNGWRRRGDLSDDVADSIVGRLTHAARDAPVPAEQPFLPRRYPERWRMLGDLLGAETKRASIQGRPEATEACLRLLLDEGFADRLQDRLLNGEDVGNDPLPVPPVLGLAIIDMAAHATGHLDRLQPAAETEAARLASAVLGLAPTDARDAAARWALLWRALTDRYEGIATPGFPEGDAYLTLSYAQTRGRKLGEYIKANRDPADPASLSPPAVEVRSLARLFRFVEVSAVELPALPHLGTWPMPDRAAAEAALLERFAAVRLPQPLIEAWQRRKEPFRSRLQAFFALLDRLMPYPEHVDNSLSMMAAHWNVDLATALERAAVSVALGDEPTLVFLSALCLRIFEDLVSSPANCFPLLKLAVERVHGPRADLMKLMPRNAWLAADYGTGNEPFAKAQALLNGDGQAEVSPLNRLRDLAIVLGDLARSNGPSDLAAEQEVRSKLLVTPNKLREAVS